MMQDPVSQSVIHRLLKEGTTEWQKTIFPKRNEHIQTIFISVFNLIGVCVKWTWPKIDIKAGCCTMICISIAACCHGNHVWSTSKVVALVPLHETMSNQHFSKLLCYLRMWYEGCTLHHNLLLHYLRVEHECDQHEVQINYTFLKLSVWSTWTISFWKCSCEVLFAVN